jgi:hypothetical protein
VISFSSKVVTACGPGDRVHRVRRGREAEDAKDLGRPENVWKVLNVCDCVERVVRGNVPTLAPTLAQDGRRHQWLDEPLPYPRTES